MKMLIISIKHKDFKESQKGASYAYQLMSQQLRSRVDEPYTPMIGRVRNMFIHCINVKFSRTDDVSKIKKYILDKLDETKTQVKGLRLDIDVDPV